MIDKLLLSVVTILFVAPILEAETLYNLKVVVDKDRTGRSDASLVAVFNGPDYCRKLQGTDKYEFSVPAGNYTVEAVFGDNSAIVFLQDIEVAGDTEAHVCRDMATETVTPQIFLPDGMEGELPVFAGDKVVNEPNLNTMYSRVIVSVGGMAAFASSYMFGKGGTTPFEQCPIMVSPLGPNGEIVVTTTAESFDGTTYYCSISSIRGDDIVNKAKFGNAYSNYRRMGNKISHTPAFDKYANNQNWTTFDLMTFIGGDIPVGGGGYRTRNEVEVYYCADEISEDEGFALLRMGSADYVDISKFRLIGLYTPLFGLMDGKPMWLSTQSGSMYNIPDGPRTPHLPVNPYLCVEDRSDLTFGASNAVCVTNPFFGENYRVIKAGGYFGNYGESREIDAKLAEVTVSLDGNEVAAIPASQLDDWARRWASDGHEPGRLTMCFRDSNIEFGNMSGYNICEVSFDESGDDSLPPTLQRLMVGDGDGRFAVMLPSGASPVISMTGGDFVLTTEDEITYATCSPASIEVEIADHASEKWTKVDTEEFPERFLMPGFGYFWEARPGELADGWWDLRVRLTDDSGNTQVQTLVPCFYIGAQAGIASVARDDIVSGEVYYDLLGRKVSGEEIPPGIYIRSDGVTTSKMIVR